MRNTLIEQSQSRSLYIFLEKQWQAVINTSLFSGGELSPVGCGLFFGLPLKTEPWHNQTRASPP